MPQDGTYHLTASETGLPQGQVWKHPSSRYSLLGSGYMRTGAVIMAFFSTLKASLASYSVSKTPSSCYSGPLSCSHAMAQQSWQSPK